MGEEVGYVQLKDKGSPEANLDPLKELWMQHTLVGFDVGKFCTFPLFFA